MGYKRWRMVGIDKYELVFEPFYIEEVVAELYQDNIGDWYFTSKLTGDEELFLQEKDRSKKDVKLEAEEIVINYYKNERDYFQSLIDIFSESN